MRFSEAIDIYIADMSSQGRLNSERSRDSYRACLFRLSEQVGNRDPRTIGREDIKRFLALFSHPNTQRRQRSMCVSFFDYCMEEGWRPDNPARQTRAPKRRKPKVNRMTLEETVAFLNAAQTQRERWVAYLGVLAGLRREELRLIQGKHFARPGVILITEDIAKGGRERKLVVLDDLVSVVEEIRAEVGPDCFVFPAEQFADPPHNTRVHTYPDRPGDGKTLWRITRRIGERAGIQVPVNPHMMRHAFADHMARNTTVLVAQRMLGHADLSTTQGYLSEVTLDDLSQAVRGLSLPGLEGVKCYPPHTDPAKAVVETVGIEPTLAGIHDHDPIVQQQLRDLLDSLTPSIEVYADHFAGVA